METKITPNAPISASYIVKTADGILTSEQALGALASGILYNTTTTGVLSIAAAGTDYAAPNQTMYIGTTAVAINRASAALTLAGLTLTTPDIGTPSAGVLTNCSGTASSLTAGAVTNATFTTALTVNTGTLTLTANAANTSVLTIGAGAVSVSGANTGDNAANSSTMYIGTTEHALNRASAAETLAGITLTTPDIGTPSAGTLTNCTGLPIAGLTSSTATALGVGSIELGHATDTTIARSAAGAITVEGVAVLLSGGALGTPSGGTLTNCTGLPVAGITASTATALGVGSVELGHASDTTLSRSAAGVLAVEGVVVPTISSTSTFTNKRVTPRVSTEASSATPTINTDNVDAHSITALAANITSFTTNLSGTPTNFQRLTIRILDNGTARTIAWGASFEDAGTALPTTTVISKLLTVGLIYNTVTSKWGCVASVSET